MIEIFLELSEPHGCKSLLVERNVIASPHVAIAAKLQPRLNFQIVNSAGLRDIPGQFSRWGIILSPEGANHTKLRLSCSVGNTFGKNAHDFRILPGTLISADDVVVQDRLDVPT